MINEFNTSEYQNWIRTVRAGDQIYLSGTVYTARDAAHKRIMAMIEKGDPLPFDIHGAFIYYAGPTPTMPDRIIGSCGPTTSSRMDKFAPTLYDMGLGGTIGKGPRSEEVRAAVERNSSIYLLALGGIGALAAKSIKSLDVIAFDDLGCESVKRLTFDRFPLYVGIDSTGKTVI